ncbi:hypothetical protein OEZ86_001705 [Tetradesmus obliquus]|nr:hypothetical protein OEZ86_001705 [Tetradesmus obliquus]
MAKNKGKSYLGKAKQLATGRSKLKAGKNAKETHVQEDDVNSSQNVSSADARDEQHITATSTAVVGLSNLGNTCFFNSSVQLLLACAPLQQMLLQHEHHIAKGPLGYALQQAAMFANGRNPGHKNSPTYNPQSLLSAVCCHAPVFRGKQQHDSHELMRMLLDGLQTQEIRYRDFGCGHVSVSYEPFLDLSLPIPLAEAGSGSLTRKGSLLSRLAGRSGGGAKAAKAAAGKQPASAVGEESPPARGQT